MKVTVEEIKPVPPPKKIILELTEEEARALDYIAAVYASDAADRFRKALGFKWNESKIDWDKVFR